MTASQARAIADEHIAFWQAQDIDCCEAFWALGQRQMCRGWGHVRDRMIRWLLAHDTPAQRRSA